MSAREYVDEPLDSVTQDNIDIDLRIDGAGSFKRGSHPATEREVLQPLDDAREYDIIEAEVELIDGAKANYLKATVVGVGHNILPSEGDPTNIDDAPEIVTLDVNNELTENERDSNEITRIFTGTVANASRLGNGMMEFVAFWPGSNEIKSEDVVIVPPAALLNFAGNPDYSPRRKQISQFARMISWRVTGGTVFDYNINVADGGVLVGTRNGEELRNGYDIEVTVDSWRESINDLLDTMALKSESIWEVDRYGDFYFGAVDPEAHKLRYITDNSAGKTSPAWRSVQVIGDGVVSEDGWDASALINESPEQVQGNISDAEKDSDQLVEPTFTYRNMEINTQEEAQHVMNELRENIREQAASGYVEVIGHPEVWPGDAIELPDAPNQPFQRDRFGVKKVIHRLNNDDGFMTRIECGGLTEAKETLYQGDIQERQNFKAVVGVFRDRLRFTEVANLLEERQFEKAAAIFSDNGYEDVADQILNRQFHKAIQNILDQRIQPTELE